MVDGENMAGYRDLFVVSSALVTAYGLMPTADRVQQTLQTLHSIRVSASAADIVVLELSRERIPDEYEHMFLQAGARLVMHFSNHAAVQRNYQICSPERDPAGSSIKNLNEITAMQAFLQWCLGNQFLQTYRRVFKISGRYSLCEPFHQELYQQEGFKERCAFLRLNHSYLDTATSGSFSYMLMTRLWSFDPVLLPKLEVWFEVMLDLLVKRYEAGGYTDIEHLLAVVIPRKYCVYLDKVGVQGLIGLHGQRVVE